MSGKCFTPCGPPGPSGPSPLCVGRYNACDPCVTSGPCAKCGMCNGIWEPSACIDRLVRQQKLYSTLDYCKRNGLQDFLPSSVEGTTCRAICTKRPCFPCCRY